jgi:hypothetical protein
MRLERDVAAIRQLIEREVVHVIRHALLAEQQRSPHLRLAAVELLPVGPSAEKRASSARSAASASAPRSGLTPSAIETIRVSRYDSVEA